MIASARCVGTRARATVRAGWLGASRGEPAGADAKTSARRRTAHGRNMGDKESIRRIAIVGTHLPRRCGIATFGSALGDAIERLPGIDCFAVAINDVGRPHTYPARVKFE